MFKEFYFESMRNKNNLSYWLDKVKNSGFNLPDTIVVPLKPDLAFMIAKQDSIDKVSPLLQEYFLRSKRVRKFFSTYNKIFVKTEISCNKSDFKDCICTDINKLGDLFYKTATFGLKQYNLIPTALVLRQYIEPDVDLGTVRNGQAVTSEFRVFYNFTDKRLINIFDYWEVRNPRSYMYSSLKEIQEYTQIRPILDIRFTSLLPYLLKDTIPALIKTNLSGIWSLDFMYNNERFYLIDMALGQNSYYFDHAYARVL